MSDDTPITAEEIKNLRRGVANALLIVALVVGITIIIVIGW